MFKRRHKNNHEGVTTRETGTPLPAETRPFRYTDTDAQGRPIDLTANSREGLHYAEAGNDGQLHETREIVTSFTQQEDKRRSLHDMAAHLRGGIAPHVADQMPEDAELTGMCLVEFPVMHAVEGIENCLGFAIETSGRNTTRFYSIIEERMPSGELRVRAGERIKIPPTAPVWAANRLVPAGARVTSSVRGQAPIEGGWDDMPVPQVEEPSYERYLTATVRAAIDAADPDRKLDAMPVKPLEYEPDPQPLIPAAAGRPFSFMHEEGKDPWQKSRVLAGFPVETASGQYNVHELIESWTVRKEGGVSYGEIDDTFDRMGDNILKVKPELEGKLTAKYLIELPREEPNDPIHGLVISGDSDGMVAYNILETENGIEVTERTKIRPKKEGKYQLEVPVGSRVTAEVRGRVAANGAPVAEGQPSYEEELMRQIKDAIIDFNDEYPGKKNAVAR